YSFFLSSTSHRSLYAFPTRRSSDLGSWMKLRPTVAEMADMSSMCFIMEAMAMGAMTRMEVRSNLATEPEKSVKKGCRPTMPSPRSEEHTSELQSRFDLVCRLLLEKK